MRNAKSALRTGSKQSRRPGFVHGLAFAGVLAAIFLAAAFPAAPSAETLGSEPAPGLCGPSVSASGPGDEIVSIPAREFRARGLRAKGLDLLMESEGRVYVVASPADLARLAAGGVPFTFETERLLRSSNQASFAAAGDLNGAYHSYPEIETELRLMERDHPDIASVRELGTSLEGRLVYAIRISSVPEELARPMALPAVLFAGGHHAREWISVEVPLLFGKYLLDNSAQDAAVQDLLARCEVWIVPLVNPDGLEYAINVYRYWRKNRRANADGTFGVDINRNYGLAWGYDDIGSSGTPAAEDYRGTAAFSEPETEAVRSLFLSRDFRAALSFHSFSQTILYPWGYTAAPPATAAELLTVGQAMGGLIAGVRGTVYAVGQASTGLYLTNGDFADWTYGVSGVPSFTIELPPLDVLHGGFFNAEADIGAVFDENLPAMLYLTRYAIDHAALRRGLRRIDDGRAGSRTRRDPALPVRSGIPRRIERDR